jgi:hypothetical protein
VYPAASPAAPRVEVDVGERDWRSVLPVDRHLRRYPNTLGFAPDYEYAGGGLKLFAWAVQVSSGPIWRRRPLPRFSTTIGRTKIVTRAPQQRFSRDTRQDRRTC